MYNFIVTFGREPVNALDWYSVNRALLDDETSPMFMESLAEIDKISAERTKYIIIVKFN